jgi:lipoprotein
MKKILIVALMLVSMLFVGCDNNKGPFDYTYRNGSEILLSDGKPAKGDVSMELFNTIIWTIHFDDGLVDGDVISYNDRNVEMFSGKFKRLDDNQYDVDIKFPDGGVIKGTVNTTSEEIIELASEASTNSWDNIFLDDWFKNKAIDATIDNPRLKATKKNGIIVEQEIISGNIISHEYFDENGERDGTWTVENKNHEVTSESHYKHGELVGLQKYFRGDLGLWIYTMYDENNNMLWDTMSNDSNYELYVNDRVRGKTLTFIKAIQEPIAALASCKEFVLRKDRDLTLQDAKEIMDAVGLEKLYPDFKFDLSLYDNNNQNTNNAENYHQNGADLSSFADKDVYTAEVKNMMVTPDNQNLILMEAENGEYFYLVHAKGYGSDLVQDWKNYVKNGEGMETLIPLVHLTGEIYRGIIFKDNQDAYNYADKEGFKIYR